jgi:two-component system, chemotaxis family, sensor kinase CheA
VAETLDHLGSIEASVLALEHASDDTALINEVFRPFHSLKANAAALGITRVETLAHRVETLLDKARSGAVRIGDADVEFVLASTDLLMHMVKDLDARLRGAPGEEFTAPARVKVDTRKLDTLVDLVGELAIVQAMVQQDPHLLGVRNERLHRNLAQLQRITADLQRGSIAMRLVPVRQLFQRMSRLARDLARKSGKPVDLTVAGDDIELDRNVVEELSDPLMHMLRNSIDHGIEDAATRQQQGKPAHGRLSLHAFQEGASVVIAIEDDGCGLDSEKLRRKALEQNLLDAAAAPSEAELHMLVFHPGLSTAEAVTELSGRGMGMDVVRRNVERLRGRIEIHTRRGLGTKFLIKLPLTLATIEGLVVRAGSQRFVLPTFSVREAVRTASHRVHHVPGHGWRLELRNDLLPLARLADLFDIADADAGPDAGIAVILDDGPQRLAILVDELLGKQEIVIKPLGEVISGVRGVSGGAILADGRVSLILDAGGLMQVYRDRSSRAA